MAHTEAPITHAKLGSLTFPLYSQTIYEHVRGRIPKPFVIAQLF